MKKLLGFSATRIAVRFHDAPFVSELYADSRWKVVELKGRAQTNEERDELLLLLIGPKEVASREGGSR